MAFDVPVRARFSFTPGVRHIKSHPLRASAKAAIAALRSLTIEQLVLNRAPCADNLSTRFIPTFNIVKALVATPKLQKFQSSIDNNLSTDDFASP